MPEFSFGKIAWSLLSFIFVLGLLGFTLYLIKRYEVQFAKQVREKSNLLSR